jgi:hypothetical protein
MKILLMLVLIFQYTLNLKAQNINLRILNSKLKDGETIDVEIKNNSRYNYCFVIDTLFYIQNRLSYDGNFDNFSIYLYDDNAKTKIASSKEVNYHRSFKDSAFYYRKKNVFEKANDTLVIDERIFYKNLYKHGFINGLNIVEIKSGNSFYLKIPFNLVIYYLSQGVYQYYATNRTKSYKIAIEYMIKQEYIYKYISRKKIDSLNMKGYKLFTGTLKSNKVPLVIKKVE